MPPTDFSGRDIIKALTRNNFNIVGRTGSHVKLRYENPVDADDIRVVTVPMHDPIPVGTLRSIASQSGANNFARWCRWINRNC